MFQTTSQPLTARQLILQLLTVMPDSRASVRGLVRAGEVTGIDSNAIRVALARLKKDRLIRNAARGVYDLTEQSRPIQRQVTGWKTRHDDIVEWNGRWLAVHVAGLGKTDQSQLRQRLRALAFWGFRECAPDLFARPANLRYELNELNAQLNELGLDDDATIFEISQWPGFDSAHARNIWDCTGLERRYRDGPQQLRDLLPVLRTMPFAQAADRALRAGAGAIRDLVFDPLLPEPLVRAEARREYLQEMIRFDDIGRQMWRVVLEHEGEWPETKMVLDPILERSAA